MNTSRTVALSSAVAFAAQVAFVLLMLKWFSPQAIGEFSVISQIGNFWMTLALAQTPLSMLANHHLPAHVAAQDAWRTSLLRAMALLPVAAVAVWLSHLSFWPALLWALLLALCQMGWMLAQSWTLRTGRARQQAAVRVLPPLTAMCAAGLSIGLSSLWLADAAGTTTTTINAWSTAFLLGSALLGYAMGAVWLVPALRGSIDVAAIQPATTEPGLEGSTATEQSDNRSAKLRIAHTLVDALLATAMVLVWQRLYGAQETGYLTALLRVLGFVPAVVHMAWAQVALANGREQNKHLVAPWCLGLGAFACVLALGGSAAGALYLGLLDERWSGLWPYITPLVLWQGSACLFATFSHRPFQTKSAQRYSRLCMGLSALQAVALLTPLALMQPIDAGAHLLAFAAVSGLGLLGLTAWMTNLK